jgi:dihydrofolate reductase
MKVTIIVAMTPDRVIGRGGELPWRLPADLARFKRLTMGHPLVMGRKTYASIGRPLPGRTSIVLTRDAGLRAEGVLVAGNLNDALEQASRSPGGDEIFIVGGGEVYEQAMPLADRILVTLVNADLAGDAWFPELPPGAWRLVGEETRPRDERNPFDLAFQEFVR